VRPPRRPRPCMWRRRTPHLCCRQRHLAKHQIVLFPLRLRQHVILRSAHAGCAPPQQGALGPRCRRRRGGSPAGACLVWPFGHGNRRSCMQDSPKVHRRGSCRAIHGTWRARPARFPCLAEKEE
jgi:hypothetical protein